MVARDALAGEQPRAVDREPRAVRACWHRNAVVQAALMLSWLFSHHLLTGVYFLMDIQRCSSRYQYPAFVALLN